MTPGYDYVPYSPPITTASGQQDLGFRTITAPSLLSNRHVLAAQSWKLALGCVSGNGSTCVAVARLEEGHETTLDDESDEVEASDDEEGPHWPSSESGTRPANRWQGDAWRGGGSSGVHATSTDLDLRTIAASPTASSSCI